MSRLINKVRKNPDFVAATKWLVDQGIEWELEPPRRLGHPMLRIYYRGSSFRYSIGSSPSPRLRKENVIANIKHRIGWIEP